MNQIPEVVKAPFLNRKIGSGKTLGKWFWGYQGKINNSNNYHKEF